MDILLRFVISIELLLPRWYAIVTRDTAELGDDVLQLMGFFKDNDDIDIDIDIDNSTQIEK